MKYQVVAMRCIVSGLKKKNKNPRYIKFMAKKVLKKNKQINAMSPQWHYSYIFFRMTCKICFMWAFLLLFKAMDTFVINSVVWKRVIVLLFVLKTVNYTSVKVFAYFYVFFVFLCFFFHLLICFLLVLQMKWQYLWEQLSKDQ